MLYALSNATCQEAQKDNTDSKPLEQKHLKKYGATRALVDNLVPSMSLSIAGAGLESIKFQAVESLADFV